MIIAQLCQDSVSKYKQLFSIDNLKTRFQQGLKKPKIWTSKFKALESN